MPKRLCRRLQDLIGQLGIINRARKDQCPDKSRHRCQCTFTARLRRPSLQQAAELVNRGSEAFCHSMANGSWLSDNIGTQRGEETTMGAIVAMSYLTAQMTLSFAGFAKGKTVLSPAIGGSVGNAVTQMAKAQGAKHAMSTTTNHAKAQQARSLGFDEVIDLSVEKLSDGVRRITQGYGADIVIDAIGGEILSEALGTLAPGGSLTTLGYAAGRKATIDVTDLIWKRASMKSFSLFSQPAEVWTTAWSVIFPLLQSGAVKPIVAKTFPLAEAADALRYLVEGRPFGRVVLTI